MQPLTRGPEDDETKTMTVARPQHVCVPLSGRRQHRPARSTCADAPVPVRNIYRYATGILIVLILFRGGMVWWYYKWYLIL